jgi:hypothetical protein
VAQREAVADDRTHGSALLHGFGLGKGSSQEMDKIVRCGFGIGRRGLNLPKPTLAILRQW